MDEIINGRENLVSWVGVFVGPNKDDLIWSLDDGWENPVVNFLLNTLIQYKILSMACFKIICDQISELCIIISGTIT